jgi:hypothetical protein
MGAELAIAGAAIRGGGQIFQGVQARRATREEAKLLEQQSILEREAAEFDARQQERSFDNLLGQQRLSFAASGVELVGSPIMILEETLRDKEETINNILKTGQARATALTEQARMTRRRGRDAFISSIIRATGSTLSAGTRLSSR